MTSHAIWVGKIKEVMKSIKEKCRKSANYMFYTNDITCNLSRWNKGRNEICKRRMQKICEYFSIFFTIFVGMLLTCVALVRRIDIFDFLFFFFFCWEFHPCLLFQRHERLGKAFLIAIILGWFLYFSIMFEIGFSLFSKGVNKPLHSGIFNVTTISVKHVFKDSATFFHYLYENSNLLVLFWFESSFYLREKV